MSEVNPNTVVRVTNLADRPFKAAYAGEKWLFAPGDTRFVPYFAACNWFGDPRAVNVGDSDSSRHTQYRSQAVDRLSTLYGTYGAPWTADEPYTHMDYMDERDSTNAVYAPRPDGKFYHPRLPFVSVEDTAGNVLKTVLNDPEGIDVTPAQATSLSESRALEGTIAEMQRKMAEMQLQLARSTNGIQSNPAFEGEVGDVVNAPTVIPEANPTPVAGEPTVDGPRRGPGRPRKNP